ncbi:hypothetical protein Gohar_018854 [Gossypium harknessii]|uniref:DUF4283 domain-containing protein n=1 Tax=Gossypium harknessii TaxID=34285 RepID=A0A7J9GAM6_9ROSI|nr:hypothetical protein [Gossypium harknessii]
MSETLSMVEFVVKASPASSNFGIGHATKRRRRQLDLPLDSDGPTVDKNDVMAKLVDGISSITFSERVHKFIERKMARIIVVKLLGDEEDANKVLTSGPWVILRQYLIVRPCLSEGYYSKFLLNAIGQIIGPVLKIDENTDNAKRGRFARLTICLDLWKPQISKINRKCKELSTNHYPMFVLGADFMGIAIIHVPNCRMHNHLMRDLVIRYHRKPMKSNGRLKRKTMGCDCWLNTGNDRWDRARVMRETIIKAIMVVVPGLVSLSIINEGMIWGIILRLERN